MLKKIQISFSGSKQKKYIIVIETIDENILILIWFHDFIHRLIWNAFLTF